MAVTSSLVPVDERGRETKQHGTSEFPAAAYRTRLYHAVPWHWHEYLEAGLVRQGTVRLAIGNSVRILHAGEGFVLNADTLHALRRQNREACELISLVFSPRIVAGSMESVFWQKYMSPLLKNPVLKGLVLIPDAGWQDRVRMLYVPFSARFLSMPIAEVALPWGSASQSSTFLFSRVRAPVRLTQVVVLPTPPF